MTWTPQQAMQQRQQQQAMAFQMTIDFAWQIYQPWAVDHLGSVINRKDQLPNRELAVTHATHARTLASCFMHAFGLVDALSNPPPSPQLLTGDEEAPDDSEGPG